MKKRFYIINGSHGATYIFNISSYNLIKQSLKFYKPTNVINLFKSWIVFFYLNFLRLFPKSLLNSKLYNNSEINEYIKNFKKINIDLKLNDNSSALISPNNDKIVVNNNGKFFSKYAFNQSYVKVKNELNNYNFLKQNKINNFHIPKISNIEDNLVDKISFNIFNEIVIKKYNQSIKKGLIEIFNSLKNNKKEVQINVYANELEKELESNDIEMENINLYLDNIRTIYGNRKISLGFVHGDFKKSNLEIKDKQIILFDFEEATLKGLPLFDYFNFIIDPLILKNNPSQVVKKIFSANNTSYYQKYLSQLKESIDFRILLSLYIIKRIISYKIWNRNRYLNGYIALFEEINNE
tara:strand:+ start:11434 stop:12489 length:1056 start_codon:yes stop_codon:yes gene_type:complete